MRQCIYVSPAIVDEDGEIIPVIVKENESGYYPTTWRWGKDIEVAEKCAKTKNERLGLTPEDVEDIVISSMFKKSG